MFNKEHILAQNAVICYNYQASNFCACGLGKVNIWIPQRQKKQKIQKNVVQEAQVQFIMTISGSVILDRL